MEKEKDYLWKEYAEPFEGTEQELGEKFPMNDFVRSAVFSDSTPEYRIPIEKDSSYSMRIRLRTARGNAADVVLIAANSRQRMKIVNSSELFDYYEAVLIPEDSVIQYYFLIWCRESYYYYTEDGFTENPESARKFKLDTREIALLSGKQQVVCPVLSKGFLDDIKRRGIRKKLEQLLNLGIDAIYFNTLNSGDVSDIATSTVSEFVRTAAEGKLGIVIDQDANAEELVRIIVGESARANAISEPLDTIEQRLLEDCGEITEQSVRDAVIRSMLIEQVTWNNMPCITIGGEDKEELDFFRQMIAMYKAYPALKTGSKIILERKERTVCFGRFIEKEKFLVAINRGDKACNVNIPVWKTGNEDKEPMVRLVESNQSGYNYIAEVYRSEQGMISLKVEPYSVMVLKNMPEYLL